MNGKLKGRKVKRVRSTHSVIEDLSGMIKTVYTEAYRRRESAIKGRSNWTPGDWWNGGVVRGVKRPNIWDRAARFVLQHRLSVLPFVSFAVFEFSKRALPRPTHLVSKPVLESFRQSEQDIKQSRESIVVAFDGQRHALALALDWYDDAKELGIPFTDEEIKRQVLLDTGVQMSALFRYCLAESEGLTDLASDLFTAAVLQFMSAPKAYAGVWGEWIPVRFREEAQQLCRYEREKV